MSLNSFILVDIKQLSNSSHSNWEIWPHLIIYHMTIVLIQIYFVLKLILQGSGYAFFTHTCLCNINHVSHPTLSFPPANFPSNNFNLWTRNEDRTMSVRPTGFAKFKNVEPLSGDTSCGRRIFRSAASWKFSYWIKKTSTLLYTLKEKQARALRKRIDRWTCMEG